MGRSCFFRILLVLALLILWSSHGINRKVMATVEFGDSAPAQEIAGNFREMVEVMDYNLDPEPNTNPRTGYAYSPPPRG